ncbi:hypothetical protein ACFY2W_04495 [Streptomyces sp. NPDC001262]|uniref:hypothetical protein n=1 Tax=unclassified Streptomyces TaxID=2593676 RepID=UPI0036989CB4
MGINANINTAAATGREAVAGLVIEDLETAALSAGIGFTLFALPDTEQATGWFAA